MNRTVKATLAVILVLIIAFCAISVCQNIGKSWKVDVTEQKLYTLSGGTKAILKKLNQPITVKLYYARTAAMKAPDQIRFFNNYYEFVRALLEEYVAAANGMVRLDIIDPRPYSDEEEQAMRFGLQKFPITEEENFFFGLVVQTQFGVEKTIPFFSPDRQNFIEYDISYLIDSAITRQKRSIGILSSLPVFGDDTSGYMAQMMRMQGKEPQGPWTFIEQLRQQYEVKEIKPDVNSIESIDMLIVIHPKELKEQTRFAIDQYVLKGGRTIIMTDPYCISDRPPQQQMMYGQMQSQSSELNTLLHAWGLDMPENTFAGDRQLAARVSLRPNDRPEKLIAYLQLTSECFNKKQVATAPLNDVRMLFPGALEKYGDPNNFKDVEYTPLLMTTNRGNTWKPESPYELMMPDAARLMEKFFDGSKPVNMAYLVTGKLKSAFPNGITVENEIDDPNAPADPNGGEPKKIKVAQKLTGVKDGNDCVVAVIADVDFISDIIAYQKSFFGTMVTGDNAALLMNVIDDLSGSSELVSIRSRGNFKRPFDKVDAIEARAEKSTAEEVGRINAEIAGFEKELQDIVSSAKQGEEALVGSSIINKKKELELKIRQAKRKLKEVSRQRVVQIEKLGNKLRNINMLAAPVCILIIALVLGIYRTTRKRQYISGAGAHT